MTVHIKADLAKIIEEKTGQNVYLCYQCIRCTSGCPVTDFFDYTPNQIMRLVQIGDSEAVLNAKTPWLCAACLTCSTRCPQGLDIARIMETLTQVALEQGVKPKIPEVALFNKIFLTDANIFGRVYELGMMGSMNVLNAITNLDPKRVFEDMDLGFEMVKRSKLSFLPEISRSRLDKIENVHPTEKQIGYYPGCSLHSMAKEFDHSFKAIAKALDYELVEPEGWTCCGSSPAHHIDHYLGIKAPIINLSLAEKSGFDDLVAPCAACFNRFRTAIHETRENAELRAKLDDDIGYAYQDTVNARSISEWLANKVGVQVIKDRVKKPLQGLKVVNYYGCLLTRPPQITGHPNHEYPMDLDIVSDALGAESLDWDDKTMCCGGSLAVPAKEIMLKLSQDIVEHAYAVGAEAIIVACPLCQSNLDSRQFQMETLENRIPIIYITQLMALAFGLDEKATAFKRNMVDPRPMLQQKGLL
ncbi:MAG: 4Fe-4S dicluster domain-containing protein [Anaerolineales bacterium]|nr:4Fe-4S dicluster domain-containing protein [Anaerolineales bacterium]